MRALKFMFLNRYVPVFPLNKEMVKPKDRRFPKVEGQFPDEISVLGTIKLLGHDTYDTFTMKVKFERKKKHF